MAIFARVVDLGSFSGAARELGMTPSSVSQHVRALEQYLGAVLLHRTTRRLSLTEAGTLFYPECAKVVEASHEAHQNVAALTNDAVGDLRIAASSFIVSTYLVPALKEFIHRHPKVRLSFDVNDHNIDLVEGRIDLALRVGDGARPEDTRLGDFHAVLCAAPQYLQQRAPIHAPEDLYQHDFLLFTPLGQASAFEMKNARGDVARLRLKPRISVNHSHSLRGLALQGHGIARFLQAKVQADIDSGRLVVVLPQWQLESYSAYLTSRHHDDVPLKVQICMEHIKAYFQAHLPRPFTAGHSG